MDNIIMNTTKNILIVEDETRIRQLLRMYLEKDGYTIDEANEGQKGLHLALSQTYDLIILDVHLDTIDGLEICRKLRETKSTPILILTARGQEEEKIRGFEAGADDYVVKPFSPREVSYRIKALINRAAHTSHLSQIKTTESRVDFKKFSLDIDQRWFIANGKHILLAPMEFALLHFLLQSPYILFTREDLLKHVWKYDYYGDIRTVDTHIRRLRMKIEVISPECSMMIKTIWGLGYRFELD